VSTDPDAQARSRFIVLSALRLSGAVMMVFGLVVTAGRLPDIPKLVGYALMAIGMIDFLIVPPLLAKKWRTPSEP